MHMHHYSGVAAALISAAAQAQTSQFSHHIVVASGQTAENTSGQERLGNCAMAIPAGGDVYSALTELRTNTTFTWAILDVHGQSRSVRLRSEAHATGLPAGVKFGGFEGIYDAGEFTSFATLLSGAGIDLSNGRSYWGMNATQEFLYAREHDPIPELGTGMNFGILDRPTRAGQGRLVFTAQHRTGSNVTGGGLWLAGPTGRILVARDGQAAPGTSGTFQNMRYNSDYPPISIAGANRSGSLVFESRYTGPVGTEWGMWSYSAQDGLQPFALSRQTVISGLDSRIGFWAPSAPRLNESGLAAFRTRLIAPNNSGLLDSFTDTAIVAGTAGHLRVVARESDPVPGRTTDMLIARDSTSESPYWHAFSHPVVTERGTVAFHCDLRSIDDHDTGSGIFMDRGNGLETIVMTGDRVPGQSASGFLTAPTSHFSVNEFNDVAFLSYQNNVSGPAIMVVWQDGVGLRALARIGDPVTMPDGTTGTITSLSDSGSVPPMEAPVWDNDRNVSYWVRLTGNRTAILTAHVPGPASGAVLCIAFGITSCRTRRGRGQSTN